MAKPNKKKSDPIDSGKEVKESNDPRIDEDVPGFPDPPSSKEDMRKKEPTKKADKNRRPQ